MSIRIHKVLGYGLSDVKFDDRSIISDDRFNIDQFDKSPKIANFSEYINTLIQHENRCGFSLFEYSSRAGNITQSTINNTTQYDSLTNSNVRSVCFVPPSMNNTWYRVDDDIDYWGGSNSSDSDTKLLDTSIYPFTGFINKSTGTSASRQEGDAIRSIHDTIANGGISVASDWNLHVLGCKETWKERFNYAIPHDLIAYLQYTNTFTNDKTIYTITPMVLTFWA